jgi:glycerol-3-phosphate dehydrogenase (NAD(P)+)
MLDQNGVPSDYRWRNFNYEAALISQGVIESRRLVELLGGRPETAEGLPTTGDMYVTAKGGRNVRVGRLLGAGMEFSEAWERLDHINLEGAEAIKQIGGALPKLTERGLLGPDEMPLLRHLYEVVVLERPLDMPWKSFLAGGASTGRRQRSVHPRDRAHDCRRWDCCTAERFTETAAILACAVSYWTA